MSGNAYKILVVCMGNICRSPTAEAVLRAKAEHHGLPVMIDSAGTIGYHQGEGPDQRSQAAGEARGYSFSGIYARQVIVDDFDEFDLILAADKNNLADLLAICPTKHQPKIALYLSYSDSGTDEIPDPYYGGQRGFEHVLDLIENAAEGLLASLR